MKFNTILHIIQILFLIAIVLYLYVIKDSLSFVPQRVKMTLEEELPGE